MFGGARNIVRVIGAICLCISVAACSDSSSPPADSGVDTLAGDLSVDQQVGDMAVADQTTVDMVSGDTGPDSCVPETDLAFCQRLSKNCGSVSDQDNCGMPRTAACGTCAVPTTCNPQNTCAFETDWTVSVIDGSGDTSALSIALDSAGEPRIAYGVEVNIGSRDLRFASLAAGSWSKTTLDSGGFVGFDVGLAYNGSNAVLLEDRQTDLNLWSEGPWTSQSVGSGGRIIDLTLDSSGNPHLCQRDNNGDILRHVYFDGANWHTETVAQNFSALVAIECGIALDNSNGVHISYYAANWLELRYAYAATPGGSFAVETAADDNLSPVGRHNDIALDTSGAPVIIYTGGATDSVFVARKTGGNWTQDKIEDIGNVLDIDTSVVVDGSNNTHVTYVSPAAGHVLRYAYQPSGGGAWAIESVQHVGSMTEGYNDLAVDASGTKHIAMYNFIWGRLEYATK